MSICKKRIISLLLFFSFTFISTVGFYFQKQQEAEAFSITLTVGAVCLIGASLLAAGGFVYENRNDIVEFGTRAYNALLEDIQLMKDCFVKVGEKTSSTIIQTTSKGVDFFNSLIDRSKSIDTTVNSPYYTSFEVGTVGFLPKGVQIRFVDSPYKYYNTKLTIFSSSKAPLEMDVLKASGFGFYGGDNLQVVKQKSIYYPDWFDSYTLSNIPSDITSVKYELLSCGSLNNGIPFNGTSLVVNPPSKYLKYARSISKENSVVYNPEKPSTTKNCGVVLKSNSSGVLDAPINSIDNLLGVNSSEDLISNTDVVDINEGVKDGTITPPGTDPGTDPGTPGTPGTPGNNVGDLDTTIPKEVKLDFSPLYVSLQYKFPFCIPFDLINSFKSFAVDRQTPKFEVNFDKSVFRGGGSFTIDFEKFTTIAMILRYFLLLVFVVSLIKSTRSLIRG